MKALALGLSLLALAPAQDDPASKLGTLPGFQVELVLKADPKVHGSWINLAKDPQGRLLLGGQRNQAVTRVTIQDGKVAKEEALPIGISEVMGMLYAHGHLYVNGQGKDPSNRNVYGMFRLKETDGRLGEPEYLREWKGGAGEHGAHGIVEGRDGKLYVVCGNFVKVPDDVAPSSPHRNYADDRVLPRAEDGNGFGSGVKPPGGYVVRMDPDGRNAELFGAGQRNCYDVAFNADGELFGFDSDMEWDWGTPWYRPVRVFQVTSGADHGFREGTAKWPEHYLDGLPATVNVGIGSPTGVVFGYGAKFPARYQKAFYILDWSYGRLIAVHLEPKGAGYVGTFENFVAPKALMGGGGPKVPLNLTDAVVGADGALYFTVGGRNTQAALYRVTYTGSESTALVGARDEKGADARAKRRALEAFHGKEDPAALDAVKDALDSDDRFVRYAARIALERQPAASWSARALEEKRPRAAFASLLALARVGAAESVPGIYASLARFPAASLDETALLEKLRVVQVTIARRGPPPTDAATALVAELSPLYPAKSEAVNLELCQVLIALQAPDAVAKTVKLLEAAKTQEEQVAYVLHLRQATAGWTTELRRSYFAWWTRSRAGSAHPEEVVGWFKDAGRGYGDGASFPKFLGNFHAQAKATMSAAESEAIADVLAAYVPPGKGPAKPPAKKRSFVKAWKTEEILPDLEQVSKGRSFERGKEAYEAAQCILCHKFGSEGGAVGNDLTAVSSRFSRKDILESILEPSKVISEQAQNHRFLTKSGQLVDGRVVEETPEKVVVQPDLLKPDKVTIKKSDIDKRAASTVSPMPPDLANVLSKDEILDLLAYIESGGNRNHAAFAGSPKGADVTDRVAAAVANNRVRIEVTNDVFGDPTPGQVKKLKVDYLDGDVAGTKVVDENGVLDLKASDGKKLTIKKAFYGVVSQ